MSMKSKTLWVALLAAANGTAAYAAPPPAALTARQPVASVDIRIDQPAVDRALAVLQSKRSSDSARISPRDSLKARGVMRDADGTEHVRFNREYNGLPVIGGDFVVHSRAGQLKSVSLTLDAPLKLGVQPKISGTDAIVNAGVEFGSRYSGTPSKALVVYARTKGAPRLAWQVGFAGTDANGGPTDATYIVDALDGQVLDRWSNIHDALRPGLIVLARTPGRYCTSTDMTPATGTGNALFSGSVAVATTNCGAGFELRDPTRGNNRTHDMRDSSSQLAIGLPFNDLDNSFGNGEMTDRASIGAEIHYGIANTWDYYKNTFGRLGVANDGKGILARAHYGQNYFNAFWFDGCQCIAFGDGDGVNTRPMASLDMVGHEMSHGVTAHSAGLLYSRESGGLNEGTSDIMGTSAEFYANNPADPGDYLLGEKIYTAAGWALRVMYDPFRDGVSPNCYSSNIGNLDVHYSSGIANHFYYLLAEGSGTREIGGVVHTSPTCNGQPVVGITRAKAEQIWYRALTVYMTSNTDYPGARRATISASNDLYGVASPESTTVVAAWNAVLVR